MDETTDTETQEAEVPAYNEGMGERDLGPKMMKLYQKADSALETANYGYAISLLQAILASQPAFLLGRRKLRSAAVRQRDAAKDQGKHLQCHYLRIYAPCCFEMPGSLHARAALKHPRSSPKRQG